MSRNMKHNTEQYRPITKYGSTVQVKKTFPKTFTVQPLNVVPTAKRNSGNGKRRLTVRPLTVPFSAHVCHAHFSLATRVRYPEDFLCVFWALNESEPSYYIIIIFLYCLWNLTID